MRRLTIPLALAGLLSLVACAPAGLEDPSHPTGSRTLAASSDGQRVYALHPDARQLAVIDPDTGVGTFLDLDGTPARVARAGDTVLVTLRDAGAVAVFQESSGGLRPVDTVAVGPDPVGVVAHRGGRAWVAVGLGEEVVEFDTETLEITRRFPIPGQPRWLALHPRGTSLFVLGARRGRIHHVDLDTEAVRTLDAPEHVLLKERRGIVEVPLRARPTGDPSITPDGRRLVVPMLYVDNTSIVTGDDGAGEPPPPGGGGYASAGDGPGRTNPVLTLLELEPDGTPRLETLRSLLVTGFRMAHGADGLEPGALVGVRSYIASTAISPDGLMVLASLEGSETVLGVPLEVGSDLQYRKGARSNGVAMDMAQFERRGAVSVRTGFGPRGVLFLDPTRAVVETWLDRGLAEVPVIEALGGLGADISSFGDEPLGDVLGLEAAAPLSLGPSVLPAGVEEGRRAFFRATDSQMAAHGGGISCATCHFEGRDDGTTWVFPDGPRQTPSLAGPVSETAPVTWTHDVRTVAEEVRLTSRIRMGGTGADTQTSWDVEAFIDSTPYPGGLGAAVDDPAWADAVARGRAVFEGEAGCADCHTGPLLTDSQTWPMFGLTAVRTPTLRGVAATAPYLHDGSAPTLAALVDMAEQGGMGRTDHLSPAQKADLVAYLESL
jgi:mono/diheme cytochrome c family protein